MNETSFQGAMMVKRYVDRGFPLLYWATEIEALCPKCGSAGVINGNPSWRERWAIFSCQYCGHSLKTERDGWHGPVVGHSRRPCGQCGYQWVTKAVSFKNYAAIKKSTTKAKCSKCNSLNELTLSFLYAEPAYHAIDPFFGLELALKEDTRYGTVWVYSAEHLMHLKGYVSARVRENHTMNSSYFSRLPAWIKSYKNREMVLKVIKKLEKRLITKTLS
ncbi:hypothetical protein [Dickeya chrysanthemi]|uniref:hypothetical protein n=1 Tax=Dickeya chrysanthemi TaxID=556 RepID=UPI0018C97102|nr:hypothetical protein [Dickeya chrysanthemi]